MIPTLAKLIVLAALVFIGWNLCKWIKNIKPAQNDIIDSTPCPKCGTYIAKGDEPNCDNDSCPYK